MMELKEGAIYRCADLNVRRLDKVEDNFLTYSLPIDRKGNKVSWMKVSKTYRNQVEMSFTHGVIITEEEV